MFFIEMQLKFYYLHSRDSCQSSDIIFSTFCFKDPDCIGKSDGKYVVNNTCQAYYICSNQRQTQVIQCDTNQYYDQLSGQCSVNYPSGGVCQSMYLFIIQYHLYTEV